MILKRADRFTLCITNHKKIRVAPRKLALWMAHTLTASIVYPVQKKFLRTTKGENWSGIKRGSWIEKQDSGNSHDKSE